MDSLVLTFQQPPRSLSIVRYSDSRVSRWYREVKIATNVRFLSLVRVMMKYHNQKQVGEERVYLADTSISLFSPEGSQDRKSNRAGT